MNHITSFFSVSAIALVLATGTAHADTGKTRDQVQAELAAARQSGDIGFGDQGLTLRQMYPERYTPAATVDSAQPGSTEVSAGKNREQVRAELIAAEQAGDIQWGDEGKTLRDLYPARYSHNNAATGDLADTGSATN